jgi:hypothetical protein
MKTKIGLETDLCLAGSAILPIFKFSVVTKGKNHYWANDQKTYMARVKQKETTQGGKMKN